MKRQPASKKSPSSGKTRKGDLPQRRRTENLPGGLHYFEDDLAVEGVLEANVITCGAWLLEFLEFEAGEISFLVAEEEIRPLFRSIAIFYPPFTITRPRFRNAKARLKGVAGAAAALLPARISRKPLAFEIDCAEPVKSAARVVEIVKSARGAVFVDPFPNASLLSRRAKRLIDENYRVFPSIARVAARLRVSHEHLTRQFKRDYRLTPSAYLHQLRIADASFRLVRGEPIIDVSGEVGYNDLSRFYKQFRKSTDHSPGVCRTLK
jgi:AraC-like DNA-binding protein